MDKFKIEVLKGILVEHIKSCELNGDCGSTLFFDTEIMNYILQLIKSEENRAFGRMLEKEHKLKKEKENV